MENDPTLAESITNQELNKQQRYWLNHYQASQSSGNSMAAYTREHGLAIKSFYYWKKRLSKLGAIDPEPLSSSPFFHQVRFQQTQVFDAACTIRFPNGIECEMIGMDESGLEHLLVSVSRLQQ